MPRISIQVDGRTVKTEEGTTVAAALLNAGITRFRESVSNHSRGPICGMGICFECRVTIGGERHVRACMAPCRPGMEIETGG